MHLGSDETLDGSISITCMIRPTLISAVLHVRIARGLHSTVDAMERWNGRVALVTGASAGIGAAISKSLVLKGMKVVGCGRNLDKLRELEGAIRGSGSFHPLQCDISQEDDILDMFKVIKKEHGGVDVCINNAGLSHNAPLLSGKTDMWREMLNVNVLALSIITREAYKSMKNRGVDDGQLINISSMAGHRVINSKAGHFYSASKYAVRALTEGLRQEIRETKSNIRVAEISPGLVDTDFHVKAVGEQSAERLFKSLKGLEAQDVADSVMYILSAPPHVQIHDVLMRPTHQVS